MKEPNAESAVLPSVGKQYENDRETFNKEARKQTQEHALPKPQDEVASNASSE